MELINRIIGSKKFVLAMVPVTANLIGDLVGFDPTHLFMLVIDVAFATLVLAQFGLDFKWGSASDGTLK